MYPIGISPRNTNIYQTGWDIQIYTISEAMNIKTMSIRTGTELESLTKPCLRFPWNSSMDSIGDEAEKNGVVERHAASEVVFSFIWYNYCTPYQNKCKSYDDIIECIDKRSSKALRHEDTPRVQSPEWSNLQSEKLTQVTLHLKNKRLALENFTLIHLRFKKYTSKNILLIFYIQLLWFYFVIFIVLGY